MAGAGAGKGFGTPAEVPAWVGFVLLPLLNLGAALAASGLLILVIGENPVDVLSLMLFEAVGYGEAIGYTLYFTTNFIFAGLAVAMAFHAGLFNIGGEGQATLAGLGVTLAALGLAGWPWPLAALASLASAAAFGAAWAFLPGWLQARRGSHIVITTIMFNFLAAALMNYLLVDVLIEPGQQNPQSRTFAEGVWLPALDRAFGWFGVEIAASPLNLSLLWALVCCGLFWAFLWHTRWGYAIRVVGENERAAVYAGIDPARIVVLAMLVSGALAGFVAVNVILGSQHRLILNFTEGVGFVGIAVALMGRNHPLGIVPAALLFGVLTQGGSQISFEYPTINRELVMVIQGLVILFAGALENLFRPRIEALFRRRGTRVPAAAGGTP